MTGGTGTGGLGTRRAIAALVVGLSLLVGAQDARAQDADDGLRVLSGWVFRIDPAAGVVHVTVRLDLTNESPPQFGAGYVRTSYLPEMAIPVLAEATSISAVREADGSSLPVRVEPTDVPELSVVVVDLQPDLYFEGRDVVVITYDLPGQAPRSSGLTRVNAAFSALIPLFIGDPGLVDVEIVVPDGYEVEFVGDQLRSSRRSGEVVYTARQIADPSAFDASVVVRDDERLTSRTVRAGSHDVEVLWWPGDDAWGEFVTDLVAEAVPALEELIDQPLPVDDLRITETIAPYLYGYAGWYSDVDHSIDVGEELDADVVVHELAHAWFNDEWFSERWIGEAFAQEYASRARVLMGDPISGPGAAAVDDPGRLPLVEWSEPNLLDDISAEQEAYGYNAAWVVLRTVTDEVGMVRMAEVLAAIDAESIAYTGDPDPEHWSGRTDWRRLLDLLQNVGGSALAEGSFHDLVVPEAGRYLLTERSAARDASAELAAAGDGWSEPLAVRDLLGRWRFDDAHDAMTTARRVLDARASIADVAAPVGAGLEGMESAYESAGSVDELEGLPDEWQAAARKLAAADAEADDAGGLVRGVGLLGSDLDAERAALVAAFESGDLGALDAAVADLDAAIDDASAEGERRLTGLAAAALLALVSRRVLPAYAAQRKTVKSRSSLSETDSHDLEI